MAHLCLKFKEQINTIKLKQIIYIIIQCNICLQCIEIQKHKVYIVIFINKSFNYNCRQFF